MTEIRFFVGQLMPYFAALVFLIGITYKVSKWIKAAQGKITLYPASSTPIEKWKRIAKEVLVFQGLFEGNKPLWFGTWIFHASLALIIIGHSGLLQIFPLFGMPLEWGRRT